MEEFSIGADLESAAARRNESERRDALAEFKNRGRQTDGLRRVVSNDSTSDRDFGFHLELISEEKATGRARDGQAAPAVSREICLTISSRSGGFAPLPLSWFAAQIILEDCKELHFRRFVIHAKQRRDIQTGVAARSPSYSWSNNKTVVRSAAGALVA